MEAKPETALRPSLVESAFTAAKFPPPREMDDEAAPTRQVEQTEMRPRAPENAPPARQALEARKPAEEASPLLSASAKASISSSFQSLAQTMLFKDKGMLEDMARDMLRPMLKQWLDDNLPTIVERLVRTEIERVARGGR